MLRCGAILCTLLLFQAASLEKQAYRAYQARDWAEAARLYESLHASGAGTPSTYDNLGVALASLGRWPQAEAALRKAIDLDSRHRWAYNHLGFVYREQGRYEEAIAMFRRQIAISPKDPYSYRNLAGALVLAGRLEEAEQVATTNEQYTYERGAVYIDMACDLNSLQRPAQAGKYLEMAEAAGVERSLLAQERGHYFLVLGDPRSAEQEYKKALEYQPYQPVAALRLGSLYWSTGNLEKAAAAFERFVSVDAAGRVTIRTSANTTKTATVAELRSSHDAGSAILGEVPLDLGRAAQLVEIQRLRSDPARFAAACRELLAGKNPPAAEAALRDALGWSLLQQRRLPEALDELRRAWSLDPARRLTAFHLGSALEKSGQLEKALELYTRSLVPLPETAIDCGCEQPDVAFREKIARELYAKLRGAAKGFEDYRAGQQGK